MKTELRLIFVFLATVLVGLALYKISFIIAPFLIALILSYFLHPAICYLEKKKIPRSLAVLLVTAIFFAIFVALALVVMPLIYDQIILLIKTIPSYFSVFKADIYPKIVDLAANYSIPLTLGADFAFDSKEATEFVRRIFLEIFDSSTGVFDFFSIIFIVPILVFYLLKDWKLLKGGVFGLIPTSYYEKVTKLLNDIDGNLSGYMRGQAIVCVVMAGVYSSLLLIVGLDFGLLIGVFTGVFSFVPYVGALTGFCTAIVIALFQWGFSAVDISLVVGAFLIGQFLESNFLTPRLIGEKIGVYPVWVIFGIFAFGALFGFVGVLLAMPLTAIAAVLIKDLALEYKKRYVKK